MYSEASTHGWLAGYPLKIVKSSWENVDDFGVHLQYNNNLNLCFLRYIPHSMFSFNSLVPGIH